MIRSDRHYYDDSRFFDIIVGSAHFRVPFAILAALCQVFQDCNTLPVTSEDDNTHTLELHSVTPDEFRAFLDFMFKPHPINHFSIADFEAILRLSDMYDAPSGIEFVREHLPIGDVDPARLMSLALRWQVSVWFLASYCKLAASPLEINEEMNGFPPAILAALQGTRSMLEGKRQHIIDCKPEPYRSLAYSAGCTHQSRGTCYYSMRDIYNTSIHSLVESWGAAGEIIKILRSDVHRSTLCRACSKYYVNSYSRPFLTELRETEKEARDALSSLNFLDADAKSVHLPMRLLVGDAN